MVSHLNFPYLWVECSDADTCPKAAHVDMGPDQLNGSPLEWVKVLLGCDTLTEFRIGWWDENEEFHRVDGPAYETARAIQWRIHGEFHRIGGPASITTSSTTWWVNGELHREDGPAVISSNGNRMWMRHNNAHREDGPAVIEADGTEVWMRDGEIVEAGS